jgi:hypothetical protein
VTTFTDNAAAFATTREQWCEQQINALLAELDDHLATVRTHPDAADYLAAMADRITAVEAMKR